MHPLPFPPVAGIADPEASGSRWWRSVREAHRGGLRWVCLRAKGASRDERLAWARAVAGLPEVFLTVHGDPEVAEKLRAPGLHLPSRGIDVANVRRRLPGVLLGVSCHSPEELRAARRAGADYAFLSPFHPPTCKPAQGGALGEQGFRRMAAAAGLPVLALGGVAPERVAAAARAGAAGVAVLGSLFFAPDVERRAAEYVRRVRAAFPSPVQRGEGP
ncbi:MAG: thiamine phosphate synthase [Deferrisomatales bacterium]